MIPLEQLANDQHILDIVLRSSGWKKGRADFGYPACNLNLYTRRDATQPVCLGRVGWPVVILVCWHDVTAIVARAWLERLRWLQEGVGLSGSRQKKNKK